MQYLSAAPRASALIESMRDIGYSLETALADIVDNAITAEAGRINIFLDTSKEDPVIAIVDDGHGMSRDELIEAMRLGSKSPLDNREENDLGRFGLGLKTASFSQCRRLTVITRKDGNTNMACWDLGYVEKHDDWLIQIHDSNEINDLPFVDKLDSSGTIVLWENLDRLVDQSTGKVLKDHLYERLDSASRHLELVFHRFLAGERPFCKIRLAINYRELEPFDPFHSKHPATIQLREEVITLEQHAIRIQPFILPHYKKVSPQDWEKYGGRAGYLKNQGFYVYRAGRLIIHGTWFRLARQTELTKLARVRVDMSNGLDHYWKIDVKKASAQLPVVVRSRLKKIIDEIAGSSNRVYTARGRRLTDPSIISLWCRRVDKNEIFYEVNRSHPAIKSLINNLDQGRHNQFTSILVAIEKSFPVDALFSDAAGQPENISHGQISEDSLHQLVKLTFKVFREQGLDRKMILETFRKTEPFRSNWEVSEKILKELLTETENEN